VSVRDRFANFGFCYCLPAAIFLQKNRSGVLVRRCFLRNIFVTVYSLRFFYKKIAGGNIITKKIFLKKPLTDTPWQKTGLKFAKFFKIWGQKIARA
jgi:hypothetical protein